MRVKDNSRVSQLMQMRFTRFSCSVLKAKNSTVPSEKKLEPHASGQESISSPWFTSPITLSPRPLLAPVAKIIHGAQNLVAKSRPRSEQLRECLDEHVDEGDMAQGISNYRPQPVSMRLASELPIVKGSIPKGLNGLYMRNGSNFMYDPLASAHLFEGDGMIHAVMIEDGKAVSYSNDYVKTSYFKQQLEAGEPLFAKFGDMSGPRGIAVALLEELKGKAGVIDLSQGKGTANTSIIQHAGKLLALHEGDWPYEIAYRPSDGGIETVGRVTIPGWPEGMPFTAHPKTDPESGNLYFFGSQLEKKPHIQYGVLDNAGCLKSTFPINLDYPTMSHDFAVTENHLIFLHLPLCFTPEAMAQSDQGMPIGWKPDLPSRIGVMKKDATDDSEIIWFDFNPSFMIFHTAHAFEDENGVIRLFACVSDRGFSMSARAFGEEIAASMCEIRLDLNSKVTSGPRRLSNDTGEFPTSHPGLVGRRCRYAYMGTNSTDDPFGRMTGIMKFDLLAGHGDKAVAGRVSFGQGRSGGEPTFIPKTRDPVQRGGDDDGWILTYVFDEGEGGSFLEIYDGVTLKLEASIKMPHRIPSGFHSCFVPSSRL